MMLDQGVIQIPAGSGKGRTAAAFEQGMPGASWVAIARIPPFFQRLAIQPRLFFSVCPPHGAKSQIASRKVLTIAFSLSRREQ
jgi:hypothetical protein